MCSIRGRHKNQTPWRAAPLHAPRRDWPFPRAPCRPTRLQRRRTRRRAAPGAHSRRAGGLHAALRWRLRLCSRTRGTRPKPRRWKPCAAICCSAAARASRACCAKRRSCAAARRRASPRSRSCRSSRGRFVGAPARAGWLCVHLALQLRGFCARTARLTRARGPVSARAPPQLDQAAARRRCAGAARRAPAAGRGHSAQSARPLHDPPAQPLEAVLGLVAPAAGACASLRHTAPRSPGRL